MTMTAASAQRYARIAGILFFVSFVAGGFGEGYLPMKLVVANDAAATARNIVHSATLFRLGFVGYLIEAACDVGLTWTLYVLLRPVHRDLALLAVCFRLISTCGFAGAEILYFGAFRTLLGGAYLSSFTPDQVSGLALLLIRVSLAGQSVFSMFYGIASVVLGYLIYRSRFLPGWVGVLFALGGVGFVVNTFLVVLAPRFPSYALLAPTLIAGVFLASWLLVKGVDGVTWEERAAFEESRGI